MYSHHLWRERYIFLRKKKHFFRWTGIDQENKMLKLFSHRRSHHGFNKGWVMSFQYEILPWFPGSMSVLLSDTSKRISMQNKTKMLVIFVILRERFASWWILWAPLFISYNYEAELLKTRYFNGRLATASWTCWQANHLSRVNPHKPICSEFARQGKKAHNPLRTSWMCRPCFI